MERQRGPAALLRRPAIQVARRGGAGGNQGLDHATETQASGKAAAVRKGVDGKR